MIDAAFAHNDAEAASSFSLPRTIELCIPDIASATDFDASAVFLRYIDQRLLPKDLVLKETSDWHEAVYDIKTLAVRGAPAIGVCGAAAVALWCCTDGMQISADSYSEELHLAAHSISSARPTAVNLARDINDIVAIIDPLIASSSNKEIAMAACSFVKTIEGLAESCSRAIGENGAKLFTKRSSILTHCNAGSLATVYYGTALAVVYRAFERGFVERVYADETRPVGQGARLTTWELSRSGVPVTLICDNMAASLMAQGKIDAVVVGADRITANGDVVNKIGTYSVAVLARHHGIPFYVAAPNTTIDPKLDTGSQVVIEQRSVSEVLPEPISGVDVFNPAFDMTPASLVTKIITETGVYDPTDIVLSLSSDVAKNFQIDSPRK